MVVETQASDPKFMYHWPRDPAFLKSSRTNSSSEHLNILLLCITLNGGHSKNVSLHYKFNIHCLLNHLAKRSLSASSRIIFKKKTCIELQKLLSTAWLF